MFPQYPWKPLGPPIEVPRDLPKEFDWSQKMAIVRIAKGTIYTATTPINDITLSSVPLSANSTLLVCLQVAKGPESPPVDISSVTWGESLLLDEKFSYPLVNTKLHLFTLSDVPAQTNFVRVNFGTNKPIRALLIIIELQNVSVSPFDASGGAIDTSTLASASTSLPTVQAEEIAIAFCGIESGILDLEGSWQLSFIEGQKEGSPDFFGMATVEGYKSLAEVGIVTAEYSHSSPQTWVMIIATFKELISSITTITGTTSYTYGFRPGIGFNQEDIQKNIPREVKIRPRRPVKVK